MASIDTSEGDAVAYAMKRMAQDATIKDNIFAVDDPKASTDAFTGLVKEMNTNNFLRKEMAQGYRGKSKALKKHTAYSIAIYGPTAKRRRRKTMMTLKAGAIRHDTKAVKVIGKTKTAYEVGFYSQYEHFPTKERFTKAGAYRGADLLYHQWMYEVQKRMTGRTGNLFVKHVEKAGEKKINKEISKAKSAGNTVSKGKKIVLATPRGSVLTGPLETQGAFGIDEI